MVLDLYYTEDESFDEAPTEANIEFTQEAIDKILFLNDAVNDLKCFSIKLKSPVTLALLKNEEPWTYNDLEDVYIEIFDKHFQWKARLSQTSTSFSTDTVSMTPFRKVATCPKADLAKYAISQDTIESSVALCRLKGVI